MHWGRIFRKWVADIEKELNFSPNTLIMRDVAQLLSVISSSIIFVSTFFHLNNTETSFFMWKWFQLEAALSTRWRSMAATRRRKSARWRETPTRPWSLTSRQTSTAPITTMLNGWRLHWFLELYQMARRCLEWTQKLASTWRVHWLKVFSRHITMACCCLDLTHPWVLSDNWPKIVH